MKWLIWLGVGLRTDVKGLIWLGVGLGTEVKWLILLGVGLRIEVKRLILLGVGLRTEVKRLILLGVGLYTEVKRLILLGAFEWTISYGRRCRRTSILNTVLSQMGISDGKLWSSSRGKVSCGYNGAFRTEL